MRAFAEDQRWASQSFVAVADAGQDPNELRQSGGDDAVRHLVEDAVPMFEFAVRTTIGRFDLETAEGRVMAIRSVAPIIAGIRDQGLRPEYIRTVAGWLGVTVEQVAHEVTTAGQAATRVPVSPPAHAQAPEATQDPRSTALPRPDLRDPVGHHHVLHGARRRSASGHGAGHCAGGRVDHRNRIVRRGFGSLVGDIDLFAVRGCDKLDRTRSDVDLAFDLARCAVDHCHAIFVAQRDVDLGPIGGEPDLHRSHTRGNARRLRQAGCVDDRNRSVLDIGDVKLGALGAEPKPVRRGAGLNAVDDLQARKIDHRHLIVA